MSGIIKFFDGSKTYIATALMAIIALWQFIAAGDFSVGAILALGSNAAIAAAIAALRHAFQKTAPAVVAAAAAPKA